MHGFWPSAEAGLDAWADRTPRTPPSTWPQRRRADLFAADLQALGACPASATPRSRTSAHGRGARPDVRARGLDARRHVHRPAPPAVRRALRRAAAGVLPVRHRDRRHVARLPPRHPRARGRRRGRRRDGGRRSPDLRRTRRVVPPRVAGGVARDGATGSVDFLLACRDAHRPQQLRARADPRAGQRPAPGRAPRGERPRLRRPAGLGEPRRPGGIAWREALGRPLAAVLGVAPAEAIARSAGAFGDLRERNPVEITLDVDGDPVPVDALLHRTVSRALGPRATPLPRRASCPRRAWWSSSSLPAGHGRSPSRTPIRPCAARSASSTGRRRCRSSTTSPRRRCGPSPASTA